MGRQIAVLAAVAVIFTTTTANAQMSHDHPFADGNRLLKTCTDLENICVSFILGVVGTLRILEEARMEPAMCLPPNSTGRQYTDVVVNYLKDRPQYRHMSPASLVMAAMARAFPCPKER